jgi:rod shape determining protein RodA
MNFRFLNIDWWILTPVFILVVIGLTTLFSINPIFFRGQLFALLLSVVIFFVVSQVDFDSLRPFAFIIYLLAVVFLSIVLFIGIESHGAVRWIDIFGFRIQFSEILKPLLSLSLASFLSGERRNTLKSFFMVILFLTPILGLIFFQPDLGNAVIYAVVVGVVLLIYGFPLWWFGLGGVPLLVTAPVIWAHLHDYQRQRLLTFIHPTNDPLGTSYNVMQAIIAVGSGGYIGKGLGEGTQSTLRFLPERQTDFIFATLSEGLGFVGSFLIIITFLFLLYRIYLLFQRSSSLNEKLFIACAFSLILIHFFVNIGMNLGILPIVGVTLPFVSLGGSSLLSNFILLGLLSSISKHLPPKDVLEIK